MLLNDESVTSLLTNAPAKPPGPRRQTLSLEQVKRKILFEQQPPAKRTRAQTAAADVITVNDSTLTAATSRSVDSVSSGEDTVLYENLKLPSQPNTDAQQCARDAHQ